MSARKPLASVPNAANSPYRTVSAAVSKRTRHQIEAQEDLTYNLEPPAKRQNTIHGRLAPRTPPQKPSTQNAEGRIFGKKPTGSQPTAFERRLLEAKENRLPDTKSKNEEQKVDRYSRIAAEPLEEIRQWQKHYRRVFPTFVFYFENPPDELRARHSKFIRTFGAREEKFFSKEVTHIITNRPIPSDSDIKAAYDAHAPSPPASSSQNHVQLRTINPSLLERTSEAQSQGSQTKTKLAFETALGRKALSNATREAEPRKWAGIADVLFKAKEMGMKIWSVDKLERISRTMLDKRVDDQFQRGPSNRNNAPVATLATKIGQEANLSHMLQNEQQSGSGASVYSSGIVPFRGPYIYVRCIDELTKPILFKEYPRVSRSEDGEWPQFRNAGAGRCPFVEDHHFEMEELRLKEELNMQEEKCHVKENVELRRSPRTRAATAAASNALNFDPPRKHILRESRGGENMMALPPSVAVSRDLRAPSEQVDEERRSPMKAPINGPNKAQPKLFRGEPAASGVQPSNITSAIRSQMISSTSAGPGAKTGTSREVHGLKRRVLEKNSVPALNSQTIRTACDPLGAARAERHIPAARRTRRQAQEMLIHIDEETTTCDEEELRRAEEVQKQSRAPSRSSKRKPKPGYCENCKDKFDDFDEHVIDRNHRKFALTQENFRSLDRLLSKLGRPLKEPDLD
ncbi:MAG: hypothetical protein LQ342_007243 [Letrouitia transgressa]|nr:MAG: hypothetical protein LQ342_007243 [Letrouitia transgressa]